MLAAISAVGSVRVTARITIPRAVSAEVRHRAILKYRLMTSCRTPRSRSAEEQRNEWPHIDLQAGFALGQVDGRASADRAAGPRLVRRFSDTAQSQLPMDVRRHLELLPC